MARCFTLVILFFNFLGVAAQPSGVLKVASTKSEIVFTFQVKNPPLQIIELAAFQNAGDIAGLMPVVTATKRGTSKIVIPRFDGERDRVYSGFMAFENGLPIGEKQFVGEFKNISENQDLYPRVTSKKGLQIQMVDDAIALGVRHAALNFNLGQMVALDASPGDFSWLADGRTFHFRRGYVEGLDASIKRLSDFGATVSLILLNYQGGEEKLNQILMHPTYDKSCPNHLSAFNTGTPEGLAYFKAGMEFLAARYSATGYPHGRVVNYIVGNEVNSHWYWANMGHVSMEKFADDYLRTVRICNTAVRKYSASARVFISLEHHWNIRYAGCDEAQGVAGRPFVSYFNQSAQAGGDFDWHVAFHPYPENLFHAQTWNDQSATFADDSPRITFKNLELLPRYLRQPKLLYHGKPRRIILSEQGFHSDATPQGELTQAAAYCFAYRKAASLDGIDSFILHRHVDHPHEGGLNLGLWRRDTAHPGSTEPAGKKPIYDVFRAADSTNWPSAFQFALPIIGLKSWKEIETSRVGK